MSDIKIKIFSIIWHNRLNGRNFSPYNDENTKCKVIRVDGWRSALIDTPAGQRMGIMFLFKIYKWWI